LKNYSRLAGRLHKNIAGLAICDETGAVQEATDNRTKAAMHQLHEQWCQSTPPAEQLFHARTADGDSLYCFRLCGEQQTTFGMLAVCVSGEAATESSEPGSNVFDALMPLSVCITNDLQLNLELDAMAGELSERYEELNLVYHTDDQVSYFREGHAALVNLVQNCADYLDVGVALLFLRGKRVSITSDARGSTIDLDIITKALDDGMYDQIQDMHEPLVVNDPNSKKLNLRHKLPYKILACPVPGTGRSFDGTLLMVNELTSANFTNSDKNILSVMTKKTAKIIQGSYDGLTGLLNRCSFEQMLEGSLAELRTSIAEHCVLHVNVDQLHLVNDNLGHEAGDAVIAKTANTILAELRDSDIVARIGGDEIGVLVHDCDIDQGRRIAEKIVEAVKASRVPWADQALEWTISIGVAAMTGSKDSAEQIMKHAVVACDVAKERGRSRVQTYGKEDTGLLEREWHMQVVGDVHAALRADHFTLFGQLIEPLQPGEEWHAEVLLRMTGADGAIIAPGTFLPASERYQLMPEIDRWVVEHALQTLATYLPNSAAESSLICSINLSGQSLCKEGFLAFVMDSIRSSGLDAEQLCFEITETAAVSNLTQAKEFIAALKSLGCRFALDDFGAGLSSFGYLKSFDVDYLKIDGALVRGMVEDPIAQAMVASVHQIGNVMGLKTIAEFVESPAIRGMLQKMGVEYAQGYAIAKPQPLIDMLIAIQAKTAVGAI
jgi:diguanylate cyclase (GGDEF)-like protein